MAVGPIEVSAEHLAELTTAREAQLVRKFVSGVPLLDLEMAAIAHIIPAAALAEPPPLQVQYSREIPEYAAEIGVDKRSVYRWVAAGVEARDALPLDNPGQILAWWARRMSRSAPDYLVKWAAKPSTSGQGGETATPSDPAGGTGGSDQSGQAGGATPRQAIDVRSLAGMGIEASVQMLRQTVEANSKLYISALANPSDDALAHYQSRLEKSVDQLRKAEEALFRFQKLRGDLAPKSEFRADLVAIMTGLRGMMRRRATNITAAVRAQLERLQVDAALLGPILGAVQSAVEIEGRRDETLLRAAKFWKATPAGEILTDPPADPVPASSPAPTAAPSPA